MKKEEYDKEMDVLKEEYSQKKEALNISYAMVNNKVGLGDIIQDHAYKIQVTKINPTVTFGGNYPECVYRGVRLKKDNTPFKNGDYETVYQSNIEEHIKI